MSTSSQFCIRQRHKEQQRLKTVLIFGFIGSTLLHGILAYALPRRSLGVPTKKAVEPMELILVDKPKPKPIPEPEPVVEPKLEPELIPEPEPVVEPEPVKAQTPPPTPEPEPRPKPKQVLTAPTQPVISTPVKVPTQPSLPKKAISPSVVETSPERRIPDTPKSVAINSAPPTPKVSSPKEGISCIDNCEPKYPNELKGAEGSAGIRLTVDPNGNVIGVELALADSNSLVNRQALLAARQMEFSSPGEDVASVQVKIDFTVEGSEYDRLAREEQERQEKAKKKRQEQEAAEHQQKLEAERQAQQEQLEQERQAHQQQLEERKKPNNKPETKPLFSRDQSELEEERLRKFRERIGNYQK